MEAQNVKAEGLMSEELVRAMGEGPLLGRGKGQA